MKKIKISIKELYEYCINKTHTGPVHIMTPDGLTPINKVILKEHTMMVLLKDSNGNEMVVGDEHIFRVKGEPIYAKDIIKWKYIYADTLDGSSEKIYYWGRIGKTNAYDINIKAPHWYAHDERGIISHNTLYLANYAAQALKAKYNIAIFTMEDGKYNWAGRIDQNLMQLTLDELKERGLSNKSSFNYIIKKGLGRLKVRSLPTGAGNVEMMRAQLTEWENKDGFRPQLIISDYLGIMAPVGKYSNSYEKGKLVAEEFRSLGQEWGAATLSAQQFNRGAYDNKAPSIDNIQDSIAIAQTADAIAGIIDMSKRPEADSDTKMEEIHHLLPMKSRITSVKKLYNVEVRADTDRQTIIDTSINRASPKSLPKKVQKEVKELEQVVKVASKVETGETIVPQTNDDFFKNL